MMRVSLCAFLVAFAPSLFAQAVDSNPRIAGLRFALTQTDMLVIPTDSVVLVRETAVPVAMWAGYGLAEDTERSEAPGLAQLIKERVPVGRAADYLKCDPYNCATTTRYAVVVVHPPVQLAANRLTAITDPDSRWMVQVELYLPGATTDGSLRTFGGAQIRLDRRPEGWVGVQYIGGNKGRPVRIPPAP
jgi:hypothetical protein